jgi:hypothetical protein
MKINGFLVVRLPQLNYLPGHLVPCVGDTCYSGVDRLSWVDVFDEDFYANRCPVAIGALAHTIKTANFDFTGIDLCQNISVAAKLLQYSNRISGRNELIAVNSLSLCPLKGVIEVDLQVDWLGYDFIRLGEWSIIAGGMFMHPSYYSNWFTRINKHGLFDDDSLLPDYLLAYEEAVTKNQSEPLGPASSSLGTVAIEVGRVRRV